MRGFKRGAAVLYVNRSWLLGAFFLAATFCGAQSAPPLQEILLGELAYTQERDELQVTAGLDLATDRQFEFGIAPDLSAPADHRLVWKLTREFNLAGGTDMD